MQSHPISSIPFFLHQFLERFGYYGIRSLFVVFIVNLEVVDYTEAIRGLGISSSIMVGGYFVSGFLGLLNQPKLITLIGLGIQIIGGLIISAGIGGDVLFIGLYMIAFGVGFSKPNALAFLGQLYKRSNALYSASMIGYLLINIAAFLGAFLMALLGDEKMFQEGFFICSLSFIGAFLSLLLAKSAMNNSEEVVEIRRPISVYFPLILGIGIIASVVFWIVFEQTVPTFYQFEEVMSNSNLRLLLQNINFIVVSAGAILLAVYYSIRKVSGPIQLTIGIGLTIISLVFLFVLNVNGYLQSNLTISVILFLVIQSCGELFLTTNCYPYIVEKVNAKFVPAIVGGLFIIITTSARFSGYVSALSLDMILISGAILMFIFGTIIMVFYLADKKT